MDTPSEAAPRRSAFGVAVVLSLLAGAGVFLGYSSLSQGSAPSSSNLLSIVQEDYATDDAAATIIIQTEYELEHDTLIAPDLNYGPIAQTHHVNYLSRSDGAEVVWYVNGEALHNGEAVSTAEYRFPEVTTWTVTAGNLETTVYSKVVRREVRDLTPDDREKYFAAVLEMYELSIEEGVKLYGNHFQSASQLIAHHLAGAANKECDHWHDDAAMVNHHVGITWKFEQSLRMIDPSVASHYWDYTRDTHDHWYKSTIFGDDFFGSASPNNDEHIVDNGNFAYLKLVEHARDFSLVYNPYGMLRSPWNTNPRPYLLRYNTTAGLLGDGYSRYPTCANFAAVIGEPLTMLNFYLNGWLHGPVHIMIGGHWNVDKRFEKALAAKVEYGADLILLLSKFLWRQGIVRLPESCSYDADESECKAWCPTQILGTDDITAEHFIKRYGLPNASSFIQEVVNEARDSIGMTDQEIIAALCEVGYPGELFTSAAPQDPIFWPLHGPIERLVQILRIWDREGKIKFDTTWGYMHAHHVPSDPHMVCDWSEVEGLQLPTCTEGICPGHKGPDILPFTGIKDVKSDETWTNLEFLDYITPDNKEMPYVYDTLSVWKGCKDGSLWKEYKSLEDDALTKMYHDRFERAGVMS